MHDERRPRRLAGGRALSAWFEGTPEDEWAPVVDVLFRIGNHTWHDLDWSADLTQGNRFIIAIRPDLWLVWRIIGTYPDWYEVVYLGDPDDSTFHS